MSLNQTSLNFTIKGWEELMFFISWQDCTEHHIRDPIKEMFLDIV